MKARGRVGILRVERWALRRASVTGKGAAGCKRASSRPCRTDLDFVQGEVLGLDRLANGWSTVREQFAIRMAGRRKDLLCRTDLND